MHEQIYITPSHLVEQIRIPDHQGLSPPGGPPVLSRRFPQAPLRRRRPPPAGLPHSPGRTPLSPSLSPGRAPPGPGWSLPAGGTASPPPVRDRAVWTHPRQKSPPFFQQGHRPHTGGPAHSPAPRPGWPAASALGLSDTGRPPAPSGTAPPGPPPGREAVKS